MMDYLSQVVGVVTEMGYQDYVSDDVILYIAVALEKHGRVSALVSWVKNRLIEHDALPPCGGRMTPGVPEYCFFPASSLTGEERAKLGTQRSPLLRLCDAYPVNRVAYRVAPRHA